MKASRIFITIPMLVLLSGCTYPALNIKDPAPVEIVKLNVDKIEVVNNSNIESRRIGLNTGFPRGTFPLRKEVQLQFHEAINRNAIKSLMAAFFVFYGEG